MIKSQQSFHKNEVLSLFAFNVLSRNQYTNLYEMKT